MHAKLIGAIYSVAKNRKPFVRGPHRRRRLTPLSLDWEIRHLSNSGRAKGRYACSAQRAPALRTARGTVSPSSRRELPTLRDERGPRRSLPLSAR